MEKMICEGNEIEIENYLENKKVYTLDIKFENKEEFERFLTIFENHGFQNGIFNFEIGEKYFKGWFGEMLYDKNYNVRVYVGIYDESEKLPRDNNGRAYGIGGCLLRMANAIRELCDILEENNILNNEQKDKIIETMNVPKTTTELRYLVYDLPKFLKESYTTIEDLKNW